MDHLGRHRGSEALVYLESRILHGVKFGLETVRVLLAELGHPERAFPALLVAGTNGKGSVAAYLDTLLHSSGLAVGRYTSPHLVRVNERIAVDGEEISDDDLELRIRTVRDVAESLVGRGEIASHPTYFEVLTVAALHHFRERGIDMAVLEVGMGARLDATNTCDPLVSAIVTIARDHEAFLGQTLEEIAREKAGVLRPEKPTVLGRLPPEAEAAIEAEARKVGARLVRAHEGTEIVEREGRLDIRSPDNAYSGWSALAGTHQRDNLVVALRMVELLVRAGVAVDLGGAGEALAGMRWPGRLERVEGTPPILLDGAHNPAAAAALADYLASSGPSGSILVFGAMRDKDVAGMARALFPLAREIVLARPLSPRAALPQEIVDRSAPLAEAAHWAEDAAEALTLARRLARPGERIVVAGSLYLVGEIRELLA